MRVIHRLFAKLTSNLIRLLVPWITIKSYDEPARDSHLIVLKKYLRP